MILLKGIEGRPNVVIFGPDSEPAQNCAHNFLAWLWVVDDSAIFPVYHIYHGLNVGLGSLLRMGLYGLVSLTVASITLLTLLWIAADNQPSRSLRSACQSQ